LQVLCFLLLSHWEPGFFFRLHFCQAIVYLALIILLFYMEDRWVYIVGILAPAGWLFATGLLGAAGRQLLRPERGQGRTNLSELPGRREHGAERRDACGVRPALAQRV